jgi:hypothetical protein
VCQYQDELPHQFEGRDWWSSARTAVLSALGFSVSWCLKIFSLSALGSNGI